MAVQTTREVPRPLTSLPETLKTVVFVTEFMLVLLVTEQASKSRDKLLRQGIVTSFGKPAD